MVEQAVAGAPRGLQDEVVEIDGDLPGGFHLRRPLTVRLTIANGEYVADVEEMDLYAFGATSEDALNNVRGRIVDQHRKFLGLGDRLSPNMREMAQRLDAVLLLRRG